MRVVRGRADTLVADREETQRLLDETGESGEPAVRVWTPGRQVAFGRRDARSDEYEVARAAAEAHGFEPVERDVGGRAVAYTDTTLAFLRAEPVDDVREGLADRYERVTSAVQRALWRAGVPAQRGEPDHSFCPGTHSLQYDGKLAGVAQRVRQDAAMTSGVCVVADHDEIARVLDDVYGALEVSFDPESVGSVAKAGGDVDGVRDEIERALVEDAAPDDADPALADAEVRWV